MEWTLKSDLFKNGVHKKEFPRDFFTERLSENIIKLDTPRVSGCIKELHMNGMFVVLHDMNAPKGYSFDIESDFPVFKLHFEIAGSYSYIPKDGKKPLLRIPGFHFNMFYVPHAKGCLKYSGSPRRTLEIMFTLGFVKKMAGDNSHVLLEKVSRVVKGNLPYVFWKKPRPISPQTGQVLEEILRCTYSGILKRTYLQAKIIVLLVDLLIETDGIPKTETKTILPKSDAEGLRLVELHIKSNLKKNLPISSLAVMAGFNESKLKGLFKQVYGTTIFKYITQLRMEKARKKILSEGITVAQAAYEVGYSNPQHFTTAFKRTLGYLPSNLKK